MEALPIIRTLLCFGGGRIHLQSRTVLFQPLLERIAGLMGVVPNMGRHSHILEQMQNMSQFSERFFFVSLLIMIDRLLPRVIASHADHALFRRRVGPIRSGGGGNILVFAVAQSLTGPRIIIMILAPQDRVVLLDAPLGHPFRLLGGYLRRRVTIVVKFHCLPG
jgi:hypothetical protein